ncbi:MAG: hypothetical protein AAFX81_18910 [Pseudomonadota bacterium]
MKELAIEPGQVLDRYPKNGNDGWGSLQNARDPDFGAGDVVAVVHRGAPVRALVLRAARSYSVRTGDWIAVYKVRLYKRDGALGVSWRWVFPGDIDRGFRCVDQTW